MFYQKVDLFGLSKVMGIVYKCKTKNAFGLLHFFVIAYIPQIGLYEPYILQSHSHILVSIIFIFEDIS